jgi:hypothetical protein
MKRSLAYQRCDSNSRCCHHCCRARSVAVTTLVVELVQTICIGIVLSNSLVNAFHIPVKPMYSVVTHPTDGITNVFHRESFRGDMLSLRPKIRIDTRISTTTMDRLQLQLLMMTSSATTEENETNNNSNNETITETSEVDAFFMSSVEDEPATSTPPVSTSTPSTNDVQAKVSSSKAAPKEEFVDTFSKAAWQMGSDFFVALRWGAANALTSSLPDNQRQILLERLDPTIATAPSVPIDNDNGLSDQDEETSASTLPSTNTPDTTDDGYERVTNSINEAVVASMVTKSQKYEQKWDREKEKILLQAEIAAQKRVETELAIQQQRYEVELQRLAAIEKNNKHNDDSNDDDDDDDDDEDDDTMASVRHPVLGPVLYDFGYKRLHLVPADVLATIPVWKKQRTYRHERAKSMSIDKMKTLHLGFPGVICIHEERSTGKIAIIDGQHRVGMMKILQEKQKQIIVDANDNNSATTGLNLIDLDHVLVEVYTETEPYSTTTKGTSKEVSGIKDHAQDLFTEINKAEPVKLVDMPGVATSKERKMISQACSKLEEQYTIMFKPSQKCRPPNVNIDNLRDTIFASNILKRHNIQSSLQLYDWLIQQNIQMGEKFASDDQLQSSLNDKVWNKAMTNEFYLGLDSSWFYN